MLNAFAKSFLTFFAGLDAENSTPDDSSCDSEPGKLLFAPLNAARATSAYSACSASFNSVRAITVLFASTFSLRASAALISSNASATATSTYASSVRRYSVSIVGSTSYSPCFSNSRRSRRCSSVSFARSLSLHASYQLFASFTIR
jgi:hypothetical protein